MQQVAPTLGRLLGSETRARLFGDDGGLCLSLSSSPASCNLRLVPLDNLPVLLAIAKACSCVDVIDMPELPGKNSKSRGLGVPNHFRGSKGSECSEGALCRKDHH